MVKSGLSVLLVEDNADHAVLARNAIASSKRLAYQVDVASSAEEAMEKLKAQVVHMIISDYRLPGKSGLELLEWLEEEKLKIPFIMMTGMGDEKTAVKAMQAGAYNYIVKDDSYLNILPHVVDEAFIQHLADTERERLELEIRQKNVALEKANRELKKLDQMKSDFIASVSHDIRTPLNSIQESLALILEGVVNAADSQGKKVLEIAKRSVGRLKVMIDDLLDFSKIEAGKMRLHLELSDVQVLVDEVLGSLKSLADKKKVAFQFQPVEGLPKIPCDPERIVQILTNLVGNAIKFTPEQGTIEIRVQLHESTHLKVSVSDTGIGVKQEDLERIFERFEQVKGASSREVKGTGLGLAICKELVKLHNGSIWAESEFGKGSRFIILLPIAQGFVREAVQPVGEVRPAA